MKKRTMVIGIVIGSIIWTVLSHYLGIDPSSLLILVGF